MSEPSGPEARDASGRSPWIRTWALPAVLLVAVLALLLLALLVRDTSGDGSAQEDTAAEATTVEDTSDEGAGPGLPAAYVALRSQDNPIVPSTDEFTVNQLLRLTLPPGTYLVSGKVGLHNRDPGAPFLAECGLVPSNEDGTRPAETDGLGADWATLHLGLSGGPGEHGEFALGVSQVLTEEGSVVLGCSGSGNTSGAFAQYGWIRAIEVESVETDLQP